MKLHDPNFIQIKTHKSPTRIALQSITQQKLKPYCNLMYQLLKLKNVKQNGQFPQYHKILKEIENKVKQNMLFMIQNRRLKQQTLQFSIKKPFLHQRQSKTLKCQTMAFKLKKCQTNILKQTHYLDNNQHKQRQIKNELNQNFNQLRKLSKTFSQNIFKFKNKYNLLERSNLLIRRHFDNLELEGKFLGYADIAQGGKIGNKEVRLNSKVKGKNGHRYKTVQASYKDNQNDYQQPYTNLDRYKIQSNKWLQNVIISNDQQIQNLIRKAKTNKLHLQGYKLYLYKGIKQEQIKQCQNILSIDQEFKNKGTKQRKLGQDKINQVKSLYEFNKQKLQMLYDTYTLYNQNIQNKIHSQNSIINTYNNQPLNINFLGQNNIKSHCTVRSNQLMSQNLNSRIIEKSNSLQLRKNISLQQIILAGATYQVRKNKNNRKRKQENKTSSNNRFSHFYDFHKNQKKGLMQKQQKREKDQKSKSKGQNENQSNSLINLMNPQAIPIDNDKIKKSNIKKTQYKYLTLAQYRKQQKQKYLNKISLNMTKLKQKLKNAK